MTTAFEESCPLRPVVAKRVRWWSSALEKRRKEVRRLFNRAYRTSAPADRDLYRAASRLYKSELRDSKRAAWRTYCGEIDGVQEASRLSKILKSEATRTPGAMRRTDGSWTGSSGETLELLLETHFPARGEVVEAREDVRGEPTDPDWALAHEIVTEESVVEAVKELEPFKAPGPDGVIPKMIIEGLEVIKPSLRAIYSASIALGYVPVAWRAVRIAFIPKSGREDYTSAKSFRPLSLTSFLLKVLEKLVKTYLVMRVLVEHPISVRQHAYQKGKSTDTALHNLVSRLERSLYYKEEALCLFFDVEGAFDKTSPLVVSRVLEGRGVRSSLVKWIDHMLRSRRAGADIGGASREIMVRGGCPQGSSLSPLLWCLVMDGLLAALEAEGAYVQAFADDGVVLIEGKYLEVICNRMQRACRVLESWSTEQGLAINPAKTELVLFSNKRKREGFRSPVIYGDQIPLSSSVKYLGITLDCRLNWSPHIENVRRKAVATFWQVRRAVGKTWGLRPQVAHWFYTAVIRPRILYGAVVWWRAASTASNIKKFSRLQRMACICITGAFSTTPTRALERIVHLTPLHIEIKGEAMARCVRLNNGGQWRDVGVLSGHRSIGRIIESEIPILTYRHPTITEVSERGPRVRFEYPTAEQWELGEYPRSADGATQCYTDGSWMESTEMAGAGLFATNPEIKRSYPLGRDTTVFQAEVFAIIEALRFAERESSCRTVNIFSDSKSAIQAIEGRLGSSELVRECRQLLAEVGREKQLTITWVPAHKGIPGNEAADELAREGAATAFCGPEPAVGLSWKRIRSKIGDWTLRRTNVEWNRCEGLRQSKMMIRRPGPGRVDWLLKLSRASIRLLTGVLTGHCGLRRHLKKCGIVEDETCPKCGREPETAAHFLASCEAFSALRFRTLGGDSLREEDLAKLEWPRILDFIRRSGRMGTE